MAAVDGNDKDVDDDTWMVYLILFAMYQEQNDYGGQVVGVQEPATLINPFDASGLPVGLLSPLKSKLIKKENYGLLPSPTEHLSRDPCGKWKAERKRQRAALRDSKVYLQSKEEKVEKKKSKCGWWGRRAAKKRPEVVQKSQPMAPPKKKKSTKQWLNYERESKGVCGRANPFPPLDLSAKVNNLVLI